ncbi:LysR family transcriptional regulator [Methylovirgula sp. 4M-Z18]|uniref:LysR family transcriptional regulator n=1 Tax=Methylovirgula sp. 4M-Z18 TaxID=2293567 RepID=UPI000E2F12D2|nr:LysR family transcriptional regulator [Methylovirgula sp. 4M-Z18]RFB75582.1 LysR family transcriptional regulator [Methylovirgula sp. 4M-Z18]
MTDMLNGIDVFVAAVDARSFAAAAARLNLSRSAVGKTIARMEARLGVRLFHRTTRTQNLTEDGQIFYERCQRALEEVRTGAAILESGRREAVGRLRVTMPVLFGRRCVAPVLARLAQQHPKLELELNFSDRLADVVEDGFDLAIRNGPIGDAGGLMQRRIGLQRMAVCAAPNYLQRHGTPMALDDLQRHEAILYARPGQIRPWLFPQDHGKPLEVLPPSRLRLDDLAAMSDAVAAGYGLAWLPCWLIRERVHKGELVLVLPELPRLLIESHALWPQSPHLPLRVRLAVDALAAELPASAEI